MGDWYEVKFLADVMYLEYANEKTDYNIIAVELTDGQIARTQAFVNKQCNEERAFYSELLKSEE